MGDELSVAWELGKQFLERWGSSSRTLASTPHEIAWIARIGVGEIRADGIGQWLHPEWPEWRLARRHLGQRLEWGWQLGAAGDADVRRKAAAGEAGGLRRSLRRSLGEAEREEMMGTMARAEGSRWPVGEMPSAMQMSQSAGEEEALANCQFCHSSGAGAPPTW